MPLVFIGAGASPTGASALSITLIVVVTVAATGDAAGAIHGVALLWLLRQRQSILKVALRMLAGDLSFRLLP
jgi:hypothetical protein